MLVVVLINNYILKWNNSKMEYYLSAVFNLSALL